MGLAMRTSLRTLTVIDAISMEFVSGELARKTVSAQYPRRRCGDAAELPALPISKRAAWISGQIIAVDSGFLGVRPPVKVS